MSVRHTVIAGASLAGVRCAEALRREGEAGPITLLSGEIEAPYDRPPLSKEFLRGAVDRADLSIARDLRGIELRLGTRAASLDVEARCVYLEDGSPLAYDRLVVATGAAARELPGLSQRNVFTLRTVADAFRLRSALARCDRVAVVGAGVLGLEVASTCRELGLEVTVIEAGATPFASVLPSELGERLGAIAERSGARVRCGLRFAGALGEPDVTQLQLSDGSELRVDAVVVAVGASPCTDWLEGSGLELKDGLVCDSRCMAMEGIAAAGDVARWRHEALGRHLRVEHWSNAAEQGAAVARVLLRGEAAPAYVPVPYFWSDQFGCKLQMCGAGGPLDEVRILEEDSGKDRLLAVLEREGETVAAFGVNAPARVAECGRALRERWMLTLGMSG